MSRRRRRPALLVAALSVAALVIGALSIGGEAVGAGAGTAGRPAVTPVAAQTAARSAVAAARPPGADRVPAISLGTGLVTLPDAATSWLATHPNDKRAALIRQDIAGEPTALWLTGNESFGNLTSAVAAARAANGTLTLTMWNIPLRYDGLSAPSTLTLPQYETWVRKVATMLGTTRAIVVLEPDALWFYDRMPSNADRTQRMKALGYAISTLETDAPGTRVYIDAGTSSGSVTPQRMAALLTQAGIARTVGFAVDVSSYAPTTEIDAYAQSIRSALQQLGLADPRFVVDSGRNGASSWSDNWCNPPGQRLGVDPGPVSSPDGQDLNLWVKAPGTSDGNCGPAGGGKGTSGGQFLPSVAYSMIVG